MEDITRAHNNFVAEILENSLITKTPILKVLTLILLHQSILIPLSFLPSFLLSLSLSLSLSLHPLAHH